MSEIKRLSFIIICLSFVFTSAWLGLQLGWYCFFTPSSLDEANQTIKSSVCSSSFTWNDFKCQAAYEYIRKTRSYDK